MQFVNYINDKHPGSSTGKTTDATPIFYKSYFSGNLYLMGILDL